MPRRSRKKKPLAHIACPPNPRRIRGPSSGAPVGPEAASLWTSKSPRLKAEAARAIGARNPVTASGLLDSALRIDERLASAVGASPRTEGTGADRALPISLRGR